MLEYYEIEVELYDRSGAAFHTQQAAARSIRQAAGEIEISEHRRVAAQDENNTELDRETTLKYLDTLENKKAQFLIGVFVQYENGQFPKAHLQMAREMAKIQSLDVLFNETGITDIQISVAFKVHNL